MKRFCDLPICNSECWTLTNCDKHKLREFVTKVLGEIYSVINVAIYYRECWALTKCEKLKRRKFVTKVSGKFTVSPVKMAVDSQV
jgi:hypothetical protein